MEVRSSGFPEAGVEQDKGLLDLGGPGDLALRSSLPAPAPEKLMTTQIKRAHCSWSPRNNPSPKIPFQDLEEQGPKQTATTALGIWIPQGKIHLLNSEQLLSTFQKKTKNQNQDLNKPGKKTSLFCSVGGKVNLRAGV